MSEQQPLLADEYPRQESSKVTTWRTRTAETLESPALHKTVIALITIDAACVLADLTYTFLVDQCSPEIEDPIWLEVLSHISLTITTLFLIEIPLALFAFGPKFYQPGGPVTHSSLHLFDALIIVVTFVLEAALKGREQELAGLLILFRLWRLVKLVGGIAVGAGEIAEETVNQLREAQESLQEMTAALREAHFENSQLRARVNELELLGVSRPY